MTHFGENPTLDQDRSADAVPATAEDDRVRLPPSACSALTRALEDWARGTDDVQNALSSLPRFDRHSGGHSEGLYVDDRRAPWLESDGELRFSLARLYSVTPAGVRLVGQIQVTAVVNRVRGGSAEAAPAPGAEVIGDAQADVRIRFYLHELDAPGTREIDSCDEFTTNVRGKHDTYADASAPRDSFDPAYL